MPAPQSLSCSIDPYGRNRCQVGVLCWAIVEIDFDENPFVVAFHGSTEGLDPGDGRGVSALFIAGPSQRRSPHARHRDHAGQCGKPNHHSTSQVHREFIASLQKESRVRGRSSRANGLNGLSAF